MSREQIYALPCFSHVSTGKCPYRERCLFLHDNTISTHDSNLKNLRRLRKSDFFSKKIHKPDSFFWYPSYMNIDNNRSYVPSCDSNVIDNIQSYQIWKRFINDVQGIRGECYKIRRFSVKLEVYSS